MHFPNHPCILHSRARDVEHPDVSTCLPRHSYPSGGRGHYAIQSISDGETLWALDGMGILRIPYYLVAGDLAQGSVDRTLSSEYKISTHPLFLVYTRAEYSTKKHKVMKDLILKWFARASKVFV